MLRIRDPGSVAFLTLVQRWKTPDPGSGINDPDPQHCRVYVLPLFEKGSENRVHFENTVTGGNILNLAQRHLPADGKGGRWGRGQ